MKHLHSEPPKALVIILAPVLLAGAIGSGIKKLIKKVKGAAVIAAILLASSAHAEVVGMVGLGKQALEHQPFERAASIGYRIHLSPSWFVKPEIGGWLGGRGKPSWFVGMPIGIQVWIPNTGAYATVAVGPSRISQPDDVLGGRGQFDTEICAGIKTDAANIDSCFKHFSSAGLVLPNLGRDMLMLQVGFGL